MKIYHIGSIIFNKNNSKREIKAIGGIQGYITDLVIYSLSKGIKIGFIGKIYNYKKINDLKYFNIQNKLTSNNIFLVLLFLKSFFIKVPTKTIIHAHRPDHLAAFILFKKVKSLITLHGQQAQTIYVRKNKIIRFIYSILERYAFKRSAAILAVDKITKKYYSKLYPNYENKIHIIPTSVNTDFFKPLNKKQIRKKFKFSKKNKIIIYVGRIAPPKRLDFIIESVSLLIKNDNNYKLLIVGDGVDFNKSIDLVKIKKLEENIIFYGARNRFELPEIFNLSDVSVLCSGNEGSPLSVKESLACGVPVVANSVGDIPDIIKDGYNGYIINDDMNDLSDKLELAIKNNKRMKDNCVKSITNFENKVINDRIINFYKTL